MTECINTTYAASNPQGYAKCGFRGKVYYHHRLVYCWHNKIDIDDIKDMVVRHSCDNPRCVNPEHLLLGTQLDNIEDRVIRNRNGKHNIGRPRKLTVLQIEEIRLYCRQTNDLDFMAIGSRYGVSRATIDNIVNRKHEYAVAGGVR